MQWVSLSARRLREASCDADRQQLLVRMSSGSIRRHESVLPHMFENLVSSNDQQFFYRFYIEPSLVSQRRTGASVLGHLFKIGVVGTGILLLSAPGLIL